MNDQEFTGERFVPGHGGVQMAYEHLHRYRFALRQACGKKVLDVASGSGYGSGLLAKVARQVWALDIDGPAVLQARRSIRDANVCFIHADSGRVPLRTGTMDLIVAFEIIEHVPDQEGMIRELARVLKPDGLALISTPNKAVYSDARKYVNPFHLREFYRDDFLDLLRSGFNSVRLLHQQVRAGSLISGDDGTARTGEILTGPLPGEERCETAPMYFLACCGCGTEGHPQADSVYLDPADSLFREWKRREIEAWTEIERLNMEIGRLGQWGRDLDIQLAQRDEMLRSLQDRSVSELKSRDETIRGLQTHLESEVSGRDQNIRSLQDRLAREIGARDDEIRKLQGEFEERTKWAFSLEQGVLERDQRLRDTNAALDSAEASLKQTSEHLARIRHALPYRVLCRLGILPK